VHGFHQTCNRLENHFGRTQRNSEVIWVKWKLVSVHLEIVLISVQDMCMLWDEHIIGSEIILGTPNGTPR
jgi:hypothetical protein